MDFSQRLQRLRKQAGLSQEGLAGLLGVTRQAVQKWEAGTARPDMDNLTALAQYFQVTLDYLVTGREEAPSPAPAVVHHYYTGWHYEYKSRRTLFGLPLVHIHLRDRGMAVARGVFALGNVSLGLFSLGGVALGLFSLGGMSLGLLLALGGIALGGVSIGGCAVGAVALGGCAVGLLAVGGGAFGAYALGGGAVGSQIAVGGSACAPLAIGTHQAQGAVALFWDADPALLRQAIHQSLSSLPPFLGRFLEGVLTLPLP